MDNNNMNTIKFLKENKIKLNGVIYKPHTICNIPNSFGKEVFEWINFRGFTYIAE